MTRARLPLPPTGLAPERRRGPRRGARRALALVLGLALLAALGCGEDGYMSRVWMDARQMDYLHYVTEEPLQVSSVPNVMAHLEREQRDPAYQVPRGAVPDDAWDGAFDDMYRLDDTADFDALRFVNLLYAYGGHPVASDALWQRTEQALLDFKYWFTDPTPERTVDGDPVTDTMWYWTENHILIFRTCELLAGQMFPDRVFTVTGMTGREHEARAREEILGWLEERIRFGFSEWHSNVYYNLDMRPLLALVEWSDDPLIRKRAAMVLDLVLLDTALHLHEGTFGATHGRSYVKDKASATTEDVFTQAKMLFGDTALPYQGRGSSSGAVFARAKRYRLPKVIRRIARHDEPMVDRERMSLPLSETESFPESEIPPANPATAPAPDAPYGFDFRDEENLPLWWSVNGQTAWPLLPLTIEVADRENLWDAQFEQFKPLENLLPDGPLEERVIRAQQLAQNLWPAINQSLLTQVNTYTYRTGEYMLSTAQDYRKGVRGSQTHTWQATLDEQAMVFTQHPGYLPSDRYEGAPPADWDWQQEDEPGPGYWTGEGSQPRAAQHENVGISIYSPQYNSFDAIGFGYRDETHAYFPHAHFDEVVQEGSWTFGRKGEAYVALYSWRDTEWRSGQPDVFQNGGEPFDLVAPGGANNVWIVECGSAEEWPGGFDAFRAAVAGSAVTVTPTGTAFEVSYDSPSQGTLELGWEGPLVVEGEPKSLDAYPRMENPFTEVAFDARRYEVSDGEYGLTLDFDTSTREATAPPSSTGSVDLPKLREALEQALEER